MSRFLQFKRCYCKIVIKPELLKSTASISKKEKIDFKQLKYKTKVPLQPTTTSAAADAATALTDSDDIEIDAKTIQLLERLSLVDLDSKAALQTLKSSIQFANKIAQLNIDENIKPLYTVLETQQLQLRADVVTEGNCRAEILSNAKITDEDYFVSPPGNIPLEQEEKNFKVPA